MEHLTSTPGEFTRNRAILVQRHTSLLRGSFQPQKKTREQVKDMKPAMPSAAHPLSPDNLINNASQLDRGAKESRQAVKSCRKRHAPLPVASTRLYLSFFFVVEEGVEGATRADLRH